MGDGGCRCRRRYRRRRQSLLDDVDELVGEEVDEPLELLELDEPVELVDDSVLDPLLDSLLDEPLPELSELLPLSEDELVDAAARDDDPRLSVL